MKNRIEWEIRQTPVLVAGEFAKNYKAICRNDNGEILHIPKKTYTPTTNEVFMEVSEKLAEITGFEHCGYQELQKGKKVLSFLKNNEKIKVCDWDCEDYMLIGNSHDGTSCFFVGATSSLLRCNNQFTNTNKKMKAYHTINNNSKVIGILEYFKAYQKTKIETIETMEKMHKIKISEKIKIQMIANVLDINLGRTDCLPELSVRKANLVESLESSILVETEDMGNTLLGLFNGVTHWTTHVRDNGHFGNVLGTNANINKKAFDFSKKLLN